MAGSVYDVDALFPDDVRFKVGGVEYAISADPDIDVIATMLSLEQRLRENDLPEEEVAPAVIAGKQLLIGLIQQRDPSVTTISIGVGGLLAVFGLICGGQSVANEVADTLTAGREPKAAAEGDLPDPLESAKPSGEPSSGSEPSTGGDPSGGWGLAGERSAHTSETLTTV